MEFLIRRDELVRTLSRVQGIVEKRPTAPILACVHVLAREDGIRLTATDKAMTYIGDVEATVRTPGEVALDAATFFNTAKVLAGDVVTVTLVDNGRVEVRCGTALFKLNAHAGQDFPVTPPLDQTRSLTMEMGELRRVIDQTLFSVAGDDNRYGLSGSHVEDVATDAGPMLRFVSTDGNRLSWSQAPYSGELGIGRKMLLPRKALNEIRKLLEGDKEPVEISFGERAGLVRFQGVMVHVRLLEADFPDYRQVLPTSSKRRVLVERELLQDALRRVSVMATDSSSSVRFAFSADGLTMTARKLDAGDSREEVAIDLAGEPITMGLNSRFLLDVLNAVPAARISMELGDTLSPCIIKVPDNDRCLFVIMPVRLD